jgi:hypothetical protein
MAELPNLKGIATKDLVETIGSGRFQASYINWSRTMQLFRDNALGWMVETVFAADGGMLHKAPVGGYLLLRLRHLDGTVTPEVPQAVMDNRNSAIAFDKITARDITDTHRRGSCLVLAFQTGLAHELWAKMPLESGYQVADEQEIQQVKSQAQTGKTTSSSTVQAAAEDAKGSKKEFISLAKEMGLIEPAIKDLIGKINENYDTGIKTLKSKDKDFILAMNDKFQASAY